MSDAQTISQNMEEGILDLLTKLLESKTISGVFSLLKTNEKHGLSYSLITEPRILKSAAPFEPLMPVNAGKVLSTFTLNGKAPKPIAVVLRPCEYRAFIELVKRVQGALDNLLIISLACGGVYSLKSIHGGKYQTYRTSYWESLAKASIDPHIRLSCKSCTDFLPLETDIVFTNLGTANGSMGCTLICQTQKGSELCPDLKGQRVSTALENDAAKDLKKARLEEKSRFQDDFKKTRKGQAGLIKTFTACLGCHACGEACPICSCLLCTFDSKTCEYHPENIGHDLEQKGGIKVPAGNLFYHLGRMSHMAVSCVKCGMCTDVCPVNIPVAEVFSLIGDSLQNVFKYFPGRDVEEPVPSGSYKENEFVEIGEQ
jgi:formate dehydrogenase (coenzyme F420) beta subunit